MRSLGYIFNRVKKKEFLKKIKNIEFFFFFFYKVKLFFKLTLYASNFFKNFFYGVVFCLKKKNFLNISFKFFDYRMDSFFFFKLTSTFLVNLILINRVFFFNKRKKSQLYYLVEARFKTFFFNLNYDIYKKDRDCLVLYFNVQKRKRITRF